MSDMNAHDHVANGLGSKGVKIPDDGDYPNPNDGNTYISTVAKSTTYVMPNVMGPTGRLYFVLNSGPDRETSRAHFAGAAGTITPSITCDTVENVEPDLDTETPIDIVARLVDTEGQLNCFGALVFFALKDGTLLGYAYSDADGVARLKRGTPMPRGKLNSGYLALFLGSRDNWSKDSGESAQEHGQWQGCVACGSFKYPPSMQSLTPTPEHAKLMLDTMVSLYRKGYYDGYLFKNEMTNAGPLDALGLGTSAF